MANSELNFSVRLQMLTDQFNQNLREARGAFESATQSIISNTNDLRTNSTRAEQALNTLFNAPANELTATIQGTVSQLNSLVRGANISEEQMQRAFSTAANHVQNLSNDLDAARARLQNMTLAGASLTSIQQAQTEIAQLEQRLQRAQTASTDLGNAMSSALNRASQTAQQTEASIDRLLGVRSNSAITADINAISQALNHLQTEFEQGRISQQEFNRLTQAGEVRLNALQAELRGTSADLNRVGNASQQADNGFGKLRETLMGFAAAYVGIDSVVRGIHALVDTSKEMDSLNQKLVYATGSAKEAGETFEYLKGIAKSLGLEQMSLADGYAQLAAATKGLNMSQEDTKTAFEGVAKATAAMSLSADDAKGVYLALSQIASKGKVSMEELTGQLGERLAPALGIAAKAMGVSTAELTKMVETGINAKEFLPKFGAALSTAFGEQAQANVETTSGKINNLTNQLTDLKVKLLDSFVGDGLNSGLQAVSNGIQSISDGLDNIDPATVGALQSNFDSLRDVVSNLIDDLVGVYDGFNDILNTIAGTDQATEKVGFLTRTLQGLAIVTGTIADGFKGIGIVTNAVIAALYQVAANIDLMESKLHPFDENLKNHFLKSSQELQKKSDEYLQKFELGINSFQSSTGKAIADATQGNNASLETMAKQAEKASNDSIASFDKLAKAANVSAKELETGFKDSIGKATRPEQVDGLISRYSDLFKQGQITSGQLVEGMNQAKVKTQELEQSVGRQIPTMAELAKAGSASATDIKTKMADTAQTLGLSFDRASIKTTEGFNKTAAAVNDVSKNFGQLKAAGYDATDLAYQGVQKLMSAAKNKADFDTLNATIVDMGKRGELSGTQVTKALEDSKKKAQELKNAIDGTTNAYNLMGIASQQELTAQAAKYKKAYEDIAKDATATESIKKQALEKYLAADAAANNQMVSNAGRAAAAQRGYADAVTENGRVVLKTSDDIHKANQEWIKGGKDVQQANSSVASSAAGIGTAYQNAARDGINALDKLETKLSETELRNKKIKDESEKERKERDANNAATLKKSFDNNKELNSKEGMIAFLVQTGVEANKATEEVERLMNQFGKNGAMNWTKANGLIDGVKLDISQMANYKTPSMYLLELSKTIKEQDKVRENEEKRLQANQDYYEKRLAREKELKEAQAEFEKLRGNDSASAEFEQANKLEEIQKKINDARRNGNVDEALHYQKMLELQKQINAEEASKIIDKNNSDAAKERAKAEKGRIDKEKAELELQANLAKTKGDTVEAVKIEQKQKLLELESQLAIANENNDKSEASRLNQLIALQTALGEQEVKNAKAKESEKAQKEAEKQAKEAKGRADEFEKNKLRLLEQASALAKTQGNEDLYKSLIAEKNKLDNQMKIQEMLQTYNNLQQINNAGYAAPAKTINVNLNFDGQTLPISLDADKEALFMEFVNRLQNDAKRQAR